MVADLQLPAPVRKLGHIIWRSLGTELLLQRYQSIILLHGWFFLIDYQLRIDWLAGGWMLTLFACFVKLVMRLLGTYSLNVIILWWFGGIFWSCAICKLQEFMTLTPFSGSRGRLVFTMFGKRGTKGCIVPFMRPLMWYVCDTVKLKVFHCEET